MSEYGHLPNHYANIARLIPQYSSNQIRNRWTNYLDPELCLDPPDENAKLFIKDWVTSKAAPIHWNRLRRELQNHTNKL
ncbi:2045_t:CDS:2, partial [Funneliformis geosporum]